MANPKRIAIPTDMSASRVFAYELPESVANELGMRFYPGYPTPFTRQQAPGAIPNERRIVKAKTEPGDTRAVGAQGVILGSIRPSEDMPFAYFVEWDDAPKLAVFVLGWKIAEL